MDDRVGEWLWGALLIAGLVYWMWKANHPRKIPPPQPEPMTFTKGPAIPAQAPDEFIVEFERTRNEAERQAHEEASHYSAKVAAEVESDERLKARLTKVATENCLEQALPRLYEEIKHYPAWSQRADWQQWNKLQLTGLREEREKAYGDGTVFFTHEGTEYGIQSRQWSGMEGASYADLTLFENGEEVFGASYGYDYDYAASYRFFDLKAFKKRGKWATMLVKLAAKIELESEKGAADFRARMASDIKAKFAE